MKSGLLLSFTSACMIGVQAVRIEQEDWWMVSPDTTATVDPVATTDSTESSAIDTSNQEWQWLVSDPAPATTTSEIADPVTQIEGDVATSLTTDSQEPLSFGTFTMVEDIQPEESQGSREPIAASQPSNDLSDISFLMTPVATTTEAAPAEPMDDVAQSEIPADGSAPTEDTVATDLSMFLNTPAEEFDVEAAAAEAARLAEEQEAARLAAE